MVTKKKVVFFFIVKKKKKGGTEPLLVPRWHFHMMRIGSCFVCLVTRQQPASRPERPLRLCNALVLSCCLSFKITSTWLSNTPAWPRCDATHHRDRQHFKLDSLWDLFFGGWGGAFFLVSYTTPGSMLCDDHVADFCCMWLSPVCPDGHPVLQPAHQGHLLPQRKLRKPTAQRAHQLPGNHTKQPPPPHPKWGLHWAGGAEGVDFLLSLEMSTSPKSVSTQKREVVRHTSVFSTCACVCGLFFWCCFFQSSCCFRFQFIEWEKNRFHLMKNAFKAKSQKMQLGWKGSFYKRAQQKNNMCYSIAARRSIESCHQIFRWWKSPDGVEKTHSFYMK